MNIGAISETDYGDIYMWGSITPDTNNVCSWENAPFNNGSSSFDSSYFNSVKDTVCPNRILAKEYDAATQIMGGDWRMPTQTECQELIDNTTNEWIADYNGTGVNGRKFTSKTDTSKYIFIPAAGSNVYGAANGVGSEGYVCSSSLNTSYSDSIWVLNFNSGSCSMFGGVARYYGVSVRGVFK